MRDNCQYFCILLQRWSISLNVVDSIGKLEMTDNRSGTELPVLKIRWGVDLPVDVHCRVGYRGNHTLCRHTIMNGPFTEELQRAWLDKPKVYHPSTLSGVVFIGKRQ